MGKKVVAVPNPTLLHNHQAELADALDANSYVVSSTVLYGRWCSLVIKIAHPISICRGLALAIKQVETREFTEFPEYNGDNFRSIIDEEMGF